MSSELNAIVNSPGMWLVSSLMIIVIIVQSAIYMRLAWKEAERLGISKEKRIASIRSATITAIGPTMSPVIIMMALIVVLGAPTTWMRMNDIGAARTELAMVTMAHNVGGVDPNSIKGFAFALWGMAINNAGWMFVALALTHKMNGVVDKMNQKYDPNLVKILISGSTIGLFSFLLARPLVPFKPTIWTTAIVSALTMMVINVVFKKYPRIQELSLGISMLAGMYTTVAFLG